MRRRAARCVSPYSTDSNYDAPDADAPPRRRPPQRRRQPRHQPAGAAVATGDARTAVAGEGQPSPAANCARPRPPPVAAKPRGESQPRSQEVLPAQRYDTRSVSTGIGDRFRAGIRSRHVISQLSLASIRGRLIEYQLRLG